jgi:hypothetical protein
MLNNFLIQTITGIKGIQNNSYYNITVTPGVDVVADSVFVADSML